MHATYASTHTHFLSLQSLIVNIPSLPHDMPLFNFKRKPLLFIKRTDYKIS